MGGETGRSTLAPLMQRKEQRAACSRLCQAAKAVRGRSSYRLDSSRTFPLSAHISSAGLTLRSWDGVLTAVLRIHNPPSTVHHALPLHDGNQRRRRRLGQQQASGLFWGRQQASQARQASKPAGPQPAFQALQHAERAGGRFLTRSRLPAAALLSHLHASLTHLNASRPMIAPVNWSSLLSWPASEVPPLALHAASSLKAGSPLQPTVWGQAPSMPCSGPYAMTADFRGGDHSNSPDGRRAMTERM